MSEALNYLYYIYDSFIDFVFNTMTISDNVSVGWIAIVVILFGIMIRSILNLPRGINQRQWRSGLKNREGK